MRTILRSEDIKLTIMVEWWRLECFKAISKSLNIRFRNHSVSVHGFASGDLLAALLAVLFVVSLGALLLLGSEEVPVVGGVDVVKHF